MTADEAVVAVLDALDGARIAYMVVGSLASNFHGIPRATRDADFVIALEPGQLQRLASQLPAGLELSRQSGFEGVTGTTRYVIALAQSPFVCELFTLSDDPHDQTRFQRRLRVHLLDRDTFVASPEDMIVTKLRWAAEAGRAKDREDVRNMLAVRGAEIDWSYVHRWTGTHGTTALLEEIRESVRER